MDFLKSFNKSISKMDGVTTDASPPKYWFGIGNYVFNRIIGGSFYKGIPQGRITCLAGPSSAGKSFVLGNIVKQAQSEGAFCLVLDSEHALDDDFMSAIGVNIREDYQYVGISKISHALDVISNFVKGYRDEYKDDPNAPKVLIALDSIDMLMTDAESDKYEKGEGNSDQGQHAKQIKQMLRPIVNDIKSLNISMVITKQVYAATQAQLLKGEGAWVINDAIRYACSQIIIITRLKLYDETAKGKEVTGIRMKVEGFKTRFTKPFQTTTIEVPYDSGMDPWSGFVDVAVQLGVVNKSGGWYSYEGCEKKMYERDLREHYPAILELCEKKKAYLIADTSEYVEDTENVSTKDKKLQLINEQQTT